MALSDVCPVEGARTRPQQRTKCQCQRPPWPGQPFIHLMAARFAANAPLAEMFAVVSQYGVTIFAHSGPCPADDRISIEPSSLRRSDPDGISESEFRQWNLFYRRSAQATRQASVLNDQIVTYINAVMGKATPQCNHVRTQGRLLI